MIGRYGRPSSRASDAQVADLGVDLLGAHDGAGHDRHPGPDGRGDEPAAAETLQLVALGERLADALEALGEDPDELALAEQPVGVLAAGQRVAGLA